MAEQHRAWPKRHVVDIAVQGLVHSKDKLRHATKSPPQVLQNSLRRPGAQEVSAWRREPLTLPESSRTNADDRLPRAPLGRVEGRDSFVEGRDVADVRPQPSV